MGKLAALWFLIMFVVGCGSSITAPIPVPEDAVRPGDFIPTEWINKGVS